MTAFTTLAMLLSSCSIKENRLLCPCWVEFDFEEGVEAMDNFSLLVYNYDEPDMEQRTEIPFLKAYKKTHNTSVRRGQKEFVVLQGQNNCTIGGHKLVTPIGYQYDSIYCWHEYMDCTYEEVVMPVKKTKHFATINITMVNNEDDQYPYLTRIRGNVNGIDLYSYSPLEGEFNCMLKAADLFEQHNVFSVRVPRQKEHNLKLDIIDPITKEVLLIMPLGQMIQETQYNWSKDVLEDISITVNYARTELGLQISDWEIVNIEAII